MVAINSIPQQEVAKGKGQMEFFLAKPITLFKEVAKKPSPWCPSGISPMLISFTRGFCVILYDTGRDIKTNLKINQFENLKIYAIIKQSSSVKVPCCFSNFPVNLPTSAHLS